MENVMKFLAGKKTYLAAGAAVLGTLAAVGNGDMSLADGVQTVITSILAMTLRAGIAKGK